MRVRDAVEDDGEALADLADSPAVQMRDVVHDRTVRVAEREAGGDGDGTGDGDGDNSGNREGDRNGDENRDGNETAIAGFVAFDATPGAVRVTFIRGSLEARERLVEEPIRFASKEGMAVGVVVPEDETETVAVLEDAGFERVGEGPRFGGDRTARFRLDPAGAAG